MKRENAYITMPAVTLRGLVIFPDQYLHFDVARDMTRASVNQAVKEKSRVFFVAQKTLDDDIPGFDGVYKTGVIAEIDQVLRVPMRPNMLHISVHGIQRARLISLDISGKYVSSVVMPVEDRKIKKSERAYADALVRETKEELLAYTESDPRISDDLMSFLLDNKDPSEITDMLASVIGMELEDRQRLLDNLDPLDRLLELNVIIAHESYMLTLESEISEKVHEKMDKNQREYYLQEQIRALSEELNGTDDESDIEQYRKKIKALKANDDIKEKLLKECSRLEKMSSSNADAMVARTYIETCLELPWGVYSKENRDTEKSKRILERDHYGLEKVKRRIIEYLAVSTVAPDIKGQIICLAGPPGVGKTSIAKSIAKATGREYVRVALGGVKDEAEIRGH